jgi:hypothetical protein
VSYSVTVQRRAQKQIARFHTSIQDRIERVLFKPSRMIPVRPGAVGSEEKTGGGYG